MHWARAASKGGFGEEEHEQEIWEDALCKGQGEQQSRGGEGKEWQKQESGASGGAHLDLPSMLKRGRK